MPTWLSANWAALLVGLAWVATTLAGGDTWAELRLGGLTRALVEVGEGWRVLASSLLQPGWIGTVLALYSLAMVGRQQPQLRLLGAFALATLVGAGVALWQDPVRVILLGPAALLGVLASAIMHGEQRGRMLAESVPPAVFYAIMAGRGELSPLVLAAGAAAGLVPLVKPVSLALTAALAVSVGMMAVRASGDSYATTQLTDPQKHFRFRAPAFLKPRASQSGIMLVGPGFTLEADSVDEKRPLDLRTEAARLAKRFSKGDVRPGKSEVVELRERVWLTMDGSFEGIHSRMAFSTQGTRVYRLSLVSSERDLERGHKLLEQVLKTFESLDPAAPKPAEPRADEKTARGKFQLGNERFAAKDYANAEKAFNQALEADPGMAEAYLSRSMTRVALGKLEPALADVNVMLEKNPLDYRAHLLRARIHSDLKRWAEARQDLDKVLELASGNIRLESVAYRDRARVRQEQGDLAGALADLREAAKRQPADPDLHYRIGTLLERTRQDPRKDYEEFLRLAPDDPRAAEVKKKL